MFCATCNLHYPDHLNYCRRCGKALVHTVVESVKESLSCTRCGARIGRGENFCQQCGYRLGVKKEEVVVGACYHCGASWRSDWLFCKTCGIDRERALLPPISAPASPARLRSSDIKFVEQISRLEKVYCPDCSAEAKPYSRYCETCGINLESESTGKLWLALETSSLPDKPEEPAATPATPAPQAENDNDGIIPGIIEKADIIDVSHVSARRRETGEKEKVKNEDLIDVSHVSVGRRETGEKEKVKNDDTIDVSHVSIRRRETGEKEKVKNEDLIDVSHVSVGRRETGEKEKAKNEDLIDVSHVSVGRRETGEKEKAKNEDLIDVSRVSVGRREASEKEKVKNEGQALSEKPQRKLLKLQRFDFGPESLHRMSKRVRSSRAVAGLLSMLIIAGVLGAIFWLARVRSASSVPPSEQAKIEVKEVASASPAQSPPAQSVRGAGEIEPIEGMVYVPRGEFEMGRERGDLYASPPFAVVVGPFFIDRTEVTNEDYLKFVKATGYPAPSSWREGKFKANEAKFPVVNVSWLDASAYAKWAEKRLPTEAEWEFAARGNDRHIYPWGNDWKAGYANADRGRNGRLAAVGSYSQGASPFGALDMCGNVWELTSGNLFDYSDITKEILPGRVIRGGAYDVPRMRATTTYRGVVPPDKGYDKTGFRCVRDVIQ
jgi:formylglycine-generating enzyme required for sulfatase activity